jgi:CO dehydrogenase/acetyl-CoA synthase beta subunit
MKEEIDVSELYVGESIRANDIFATFGDTAPAFQLAATAETLNKANKSNNSFLENFSKAAESLENSEKTSAFGLIIRIQIKENQIEMKDGISNSDLEAVIEKKIGDFLNMISGVMHEYTRDKIEIVVGKKAVATGLTFEKIERFLSESVLEEFPFVETADVFITTDSKNVAEGIKIAREIYKARDERALSLRDEDVKQFYGCKICQNGVPAHVCVITPDRPSVCGTINWFEAGASCLANLDGPIFEIEKGERIDENGGEYSGVNEAVKIGSGGENERVLLYSILEKPHTTGAVFDIIAFYIPEVNGIGLVDRNTKAPTVNWMTFQEMSDFTGYGTQISGFSGVGKTYLFSDKFLQKEGGWENVVWMAKSLKDEMLLKIKSMPENELTAKWKKLEKRISEIPTEADVSNIKELENYSND